MPPNALARRRTTSIAENFVVPALGSCFNNYVASKTTGASGDYPDGIVRLSAGTYYLNPFDLTGSVYKRAFDATKPNNNWLTIVEADGPGTVTFDLRPESAASDLGQTQTQAYDDCGNGTTTFGHGGGFRAFGTGSFRWCFDGGFKFYDGSIHLDTGQNDIIFHGGKRRFAIGEWRRQFDFTAGRHGYNTVGILLPDTSPYNDTIWGSPRMKGNCDTHGTFCCGWRLEGGARIKVIRYDVGPIGDDGMFAGNGSDHVDVIGTVFHEVDNFRDSYGGASTNQGDLVNNEMHNDCFQWTGSCDGIRFLDSTAQGHGLEFFQESGRTIQNTIIDRVQQGMSGSGGGDIGGVSTLGSSNKIASGAPTTRVSGHFYRGFSNGMGTHDHAAQVAVSPVSTFHAVLEDFGNHTVDLSGVTVHVPSGVSVDGDGFASPNTLTAFLASAEAPHQAFAAAYGAGELAAVMADYGITFS